MKRLASTKKLQRWSSRTGAITILAVLSVTLLASSQAQAGDRISGVPRVVDGDTITIGTTKIRLESIDAPESDQVCLDANGKHWA
jgi:endonuclease YncB( thermonuclease family)